MPIAMNTTRIGQEHLLAVDDGAQLRAVELVGDRDALAEEPDDPALGSLHVVVGLKDLTNGRVQQEGAEDVEDPGEVLPISCAPSRMKTPRSTRAMMAPAPSISGTSWARRTSPR